MMLCLWGTTVDVFGTTPGAILIVCGGDGAPWKAVPRLHRGAQLPCLRAFLELVLEGRRDAGKEV